METLLQRLSFLVEAGKIDLLSPYPAELRGEIGVSEVTLMALDQKIDPQVILNDGLITGLNRLGERFSRGEAFIPNMLIAARAMSVAMEHLKPFILAGANQSRGTLVLGTVQGDLHDIGKNLVKMVMQSDGWDVVDLGTDVSADSFVAAAREHAGAIVGMSALLTTTMMNMIPVVEELHTHVPGTKIFIGGAPVSQAFCEQIGADGYFSDPYRFARSFGGVTAGA